MSAMAGRRPVRRAARQAAGRRRGYERLWAHARAPLSPMQKGEEP
jgi:hypothetical protein